jgi:hypothetical protein
VVEAQIYPHVATGFTDSNAYLRELTLKSMLVLAPKLSQKTINQSLLKFLAKLQVQAAAVLASHLQDADSGLRQTCSSSVSMTGG